MVMAKGASVTALSCETSGICYVYMKGLERIGVLPTTQAREALVDRLNTIQGLSIARERAVNDYISFQVGHVDLGDFNQLLGIFDSELEKARK